MKNCLKKALSLLLCIALCIGICLPALAANENNTSGITFDVTLDTQTISVSDKAQEVTMYLTASDPVNVDGIGFTVVWDSPLSFTEIIGGDKIGEYNATATNYDNGKVGWQSADSESVEGVTELAVITFTVPANTPAGTYKVGVKELELTKGYGEIWENAASAETTLTIEGEPNEPDTPVETEGYTAGLRAPINTVNVAETVSVAVAVNHDEDDAFAAGEIVLTYDSAKLSFNAEKSTLGTATVQDNAGTLTLEDYGADKSFGDVYKLVFDAIADGTAVVTMTSAAFVDKQDAAKSDLIAATISPKSVPLTISKKQYTVTLPEIFTGNTAVEEGEDYTFSAADPDNYTYTSVTVTMGGTAVAVVDNGEGTYTIQNVTGDLVISGSRTEKNYTVTFAGNAAEDITDGAETATYNKDYTFTMPSAEGWAYSLDSITIGGTAYTGYSVKDSVYTIPGSAIKGNIVITVNKVETEAGVTVEGSGAGAADGYDPVAKIGEDYTLKIVPEAGYTYTVTATMNGEPADVIDNGDNTYTIKAVTGDIVFTVERTVVTSGVSVEQYLTLDGSVMWLVKNKIALTEGKVPIYDGENMFWSEAYDAYCWLVVADTLSVETASAEIGIADGTAAEIDYGMDVNKTGKIDASDAQLVYNMYNAMYAGIDADVTVEKYLRADVNHDGKVNVEDAAAIIAQILS